MKTPTVGLDIREKIIDEVSQGISEAQGYFFINFNKLKAEAISRLRSSLSGANAKIFVTKNSLFKVAFDKNSKSELSDFITQETALIFIYDKDMVKAAKALIDFSKENESLQLRGGVIKGQKLAAENIAALAKLPSKEMLLGMAVSGFASPITGFLTALNQVILKFVWVIEEIKNKKGK
jgi:large subunit ribosomal protein L10